MVKIERRSPCKVNLLLNILGKRPDGFHELETVFHPVPVFDRLELRREGTALRLTCNRPELPVDGRNLVYRAARLFLNEARIRDGVSIHLEKEIPLAAGLAGGSGNAAQTLSGLNELFGNPLPVEELGRLGAELGSDVPFFLQESPALATGRGERVCPLGRFSLLEGVYILLVYPGFGIATGWVYQALGRFPKALQGRPGRARELIESLERGPLEAACAGFYNSLEAPVLDKYPVLALYQEFLRAGGAAGALMSGSGSTTFALARSGAEAEELGARFKSKFGGACWMRTVRL